MLCVRFFCIAGLTLTFAVPPAFGQLGGPASPPSRDPIDDLPVSELLPKPPKSAAKPWRPVYTLDEVPEVSYEEEWSECLHEVRIDRHVIATLAKIHRLDRERPKGFLEAIQKRRADLAGLPFEAGRQWEVEMTQKHFFDFGSIVDSFASSSKKGQQIGDLLHSGWFGKLTKANVRSDDEFRVLGRFARHKLFPIDLQSRLNLVQLLQSIPEKYVAIELAKVAVYAPEPNVRHAALASLKVRNDNSFLADFLRQSLRYPLPAVVENAAGAIIELKIDDAETLEAVLDFMESAGNQDPDANSSPYELSTSVPETAVVPELVKIRHNRNCMLCHPPASSIWSGSFSVLTAAIPNPKRTSTPTETMGYGGRSTVDAIRFDVIYLTPDFSLMLPVESSSTAGKSVATERYDFLVRLRTVRRDEIAAYRRAKAYLPRSGNRTIATRILSELTDKDDVPPTRAAWEKAIQSYIDARVEHETDQIRQRYSRR
jgi:hypothetical protein